MKSNGVCPKCGADDGYEYFWAVLDVRVGSFSERDSECVDVMPLRKCPKTVVCLNCRRRVHNPEYEK